MKNDNLQKLIIEYRKEPEVILEIQKILKPLVLRLMRKWKFHQFPREIYDELFTDSLTVILVQCLKRYKPFAKKKCKFLSYFLTSLNFYLRFEYMKYFQNGKPIKKRWGRLHEFSIDFEYDSEDSNDSKDSIANHLIDKNINIRKEIDVKLIKEAIKELPYKYRKIIRDLFFNNLTLKEMSKKYKTSIEKIYEEKMKALTLLKANI